MCIHIIQHCEHIPIREHFSQNDMCTQINVVSNFPFCDYMHDVWDMDLDNFYSSPSFPHFVTVSSYTYAFLCTLFDDNYEAGLARVRLQHIMPINLSIMLLGSAH